MKFLRTARYTLADKKRNEEIWKSERRTNWQESKKIKIKLTTTYNKNEQQDVKNNGELQTKWMTVTWKTFEETIRWGPNRSIKE